MSVCCVVVETSDFSVKNGTDGRRSATRRTKITTAGRRVVFRLRAGKAGERAVEPSFWRRAFDAWSRRASSAAFEAAYFEELQ
ncbi:MAG: hypothetical protein IJO40_12220 [Thermoguttaceae bacterium]|nr:hypothetical protein [Thermoguttaceae bacterium]